jgi:hypothetical protein
MSLKELRGQGWKIGLYSVLLICWGTLLAAKNPYLVRFSPHQISFHIKHKKNTFVLVACALDLGLVRLYSGSRILELVDSGLRLEPLACGLTSCVSVLEGL